MRFLLKLGFFSTVSLHLFGIQGHSSTVWLEPLRVKISVAAVVTFTRDVGKTFAPTAEQLTPISFEKVVALDPPNEIIANVGYNPTPRSEVDYTVLRSSNAGCDWSIVGNISPEVGVLDDLTGGTGGRGYVWGRKPAFGEARLYR